MYTSVYICMNVYEKSCKELCKHVCTHVFPMYDVHYPFYIGVRHALILKVKISMYISCINVYIMKISMYIYIMY